MEHILSEVKTQIAPSRDDLSSIKTLGLGGSSVANTIRGLSACFGVASGLGGGCGDDKQGKLFIHNMSSKNVDLSRLKTKKGVTAQANELMEDNFKGSKGQTTD